MKRIVTAIICAIVTLVAAPAVAIAGGITPQGGTVTNVSATTGGGLAVTGTSARPSVGMLTSCGTGQILKWSGLAWACGTDTGGISNTAGTNIVMKSDGTNAVATTITDTGSLVSTGTPVAFGSTLIVTGKTTLLDHKYQQTGPVTLGAGLTSDWDPFSGGAPTTVVLVTANASGSQIDGMLADSSGSAPTNGALRILCNSGINHGQLTIQNAEGSLSASANQFYINSEQNVSGSGMTLSHRQCGTFFYNADRSKWQAVTQPGASRHYTIDGSITDVALASTVNNYNPTGFAYSTMLRLAPAGASTDLTGMQGTSDGDIRVLTAFGPGITIKNNSASSAAGNKFLLPNGEDITMSTYETLVFRYDGANSYWVLMGTQGDITAVSAGTGLTGGGAVGAVSLTLNMTGATCSAGTSMTALGPTGAGTCSANVSSVVAGSGITASTTSGAATVGLNITPTSCGAGNHVSAINALGVGTCTADAAGGITNSAGNNIVMKSNGTNAVASGIADNGTTISTSEAVTLSGGLDSSVGATKVGKFSGTVISPAAISGTVADWAPTGIGTATVIMITTAGTVDLTGLTGGVDGRKITLYNNGAQGVNLYHNNSGSLAANRFVLVRSSETLAANQGCSMDLTYVTSAWYETGLTCATLGPTTFSSTLTSLGNTTLASGIYMPTSEYSLNFGFNDATTATGYINNRGYNGGFTTSRNLVIADGQGAAVATFTGVGKTLNVGGWIQAGAQVYAYGGNTTLQNKGISFDYNTNATSGGEINAVGYADGVTQFRDLTIKDGKGAVVATFTGSTKQLTVAGPLNAANGSLAVSTSAVATNAPFTQINTATGVQIALFTASTLGTELDGNLTMGTGSTAIHVIDKDGSARPTLTSCGGSGAAVVGNDSSGVVTVGSGGSSACTITLNTPLSANGSCVATLRNQSSTYQVTGSGSVTGVTVTSALSTGAKIDYWCKDH